MRWPKLPLVVYGTGGMIAVLEVEQARDDEGKKADGTWEPETRTIEITERLKQRHKWSVYFHELMHATLSDSGLVNLLTTESQEALCDAVGTARVIEMEAGR